MRSSLISVLFHSSFILNNEFILPFYCYFSAFLFLAIESTFSAPSLSSYQNHPLEEIMENNKNDCELILSYKALTDQDVKTIAAYGIKNSQVSDTIHVLKSVANYEIT